MESSDIGQHLSTAMAEKSDVLRLTLSFFLSFRLIPKKLMSSYTGMEECEKTNTTTKIKITCE